jgi:hypothetical protein
MDKVENQPLRCDWRNSSIVNPSQADLVCTGKRRRGVSVNLGHSSLHLINAADRRRRVGWLLMTGS